MGVLCKLASLRQAQ